MMPRLCLWFTGLVVGAIIVGLPAAAVAQVLQPPVQLPGLPVFPRPNAPPPGPAPAPNSPPPRPERPPQSKCDPPVLPPAAVFGQAAFACDFPDPMVLKVGTAYYAYGTATGWEGKGRTFPIVRSTDLSRWRPAGDALTAEPSWSRGHLWAPSVLAARGGYFMYYSARRRRDDVHCLAVATSKGPAGPFRDRGIIACGDRRGRGYIDPAALVHRGRGYLFFSVDGPRHSISVLRLTKNLLRARGGRRTLFGVHKRWHRSPVGETVEAPWPVRRGRRFYLLYSAGCWCADYRMGLAAASRPEGPYRDSPGNPFLRGRMGLLAPGGGSLVEGPDGRPWLVFHAWTGVPDYTRGGIRTLRSAPFDWRGPRPRPLLGR